MQIFSYDQIQLTVGTKKKLGPPKLSTFFRFNCTQSYKDWKDLLAAKVFKALQPTVFVWLRLSAVFTIPRKSPQPLELDLTGEGTMYEEMCRRLEDSRAKEPVVNIVVKEIKQMVKGPPTSNAQVLLYIHVGLYFG